MGPHAKALAGCLLTFALATTGAQAVTITNGSFENATVNPGSTFVTLGAGSTSITGWTVTSGSIDYIGGYWEASEGDRSLDLSGFPTAGSISQDITGLTPGRTYRIAFDLAGNPDDPAGGVEVKVLNVFAPLGAGVYTFDASGGTHTNMQWDTRFLDFVAPASGNTTLTFQSLTFTPYGPALDNVSLSLVPVPAALPLFASALGAAGLFGFRRNRKAALAAA